MRHSRPTTRLTDSTNTRSYWIDIAIYVILSSLILLAFSQVIHFEFINYDDQQYVFQNAHVLAGVTFDSVKWAFTSAVVGNWAPVTMLSHVAACELFGIESGMHHFVNVVIHLIASLLLFAVMQRATAERWPSAFVAFVFALHPLHVESVAWVAERKDVLSAMFWFLGMYAYLRYLESPGPTRYLVILAAYCLGLMSKSMLVTFPMTLLLFDMWPLKRPLNLKLVWEKLPLFGLTAIFSVVTYWVQRSAGAFSEVPFGGRVENALVSYVIYIQKLFWPAGLAMFYMYPPSTPLWQPISALAVLVAISALAIYTRYKRPYFISGWLWYLGTLVPVIGLVQVGAQSHADRYTYIPMVGLSWILAFGASDLLKRWPSLKPIVSIAAIAICTVCVVLTRIQTGYWKDEVSLFQHAVEVTDNNFWVRHNLGTAHYTVATRLMDGRHDSEAIDHLQKALVLRPDLAEAHNNLGILLARTPGASKDAITQFLAAVNLDPNLPQAHRNLGMLLVRSPESIDQGIAQLEIAQRLQPDPSVAQLIDYARRTKRSQSAHP